MSIDASIFVALSDLQRFAVSAILLLMSDLFKENARKVHNLQIVSPDLRQPSLLGSFHAVRRPYNFPTV
jgi:hypothetical protein